jgi:predicted nucleic acid-binding protein
MKTVYVDTSVLGGCFEPEFADASLALFDKFKRGKQLLMHSDILEEELEEAPERVRMQLSKIPRRFKTLVRSTVKVKRLSKLYIQEGLLTPKDKMDALHIAMATLNCADVIVSWNFRHMVNKDKEKLYNSINRFMGFRTIEIKSPREL